jgi:hypothetical protein
MKRFLPYPSAPILSHSATLAIALWTALGAGLLTLVPEPAEAQSAQEIVARALDENIRRLAGVENLTIRSEVVGISMTTYLEKEMVDGYPVLWPREVGGMGMGVEIDDEPWEFLTNPRDLYGSAAEHWVLEGRGSVEGRPTWRLSIDGANIPGVADGDWGDDEAVFEAGRMVMELDQERLVPLRMEIEGLQEMEGGGAVGMSIAMTFSDYREVGGYLHPFLTVMEMTMGEGGMDPAELAEAQESWEEFQRQMEQMPPEQRRMMEEMMGDQIRAFQGMLSGEPMLTEVRVTEILVNQGPPER